MRRGMRQGLLARRPTCEICWQEEPQAVVKTVLFTLPGRLSVDVPGPDDLEARAAAPDTKTSSSAAAGRSRRPRRPLPRNA